MIELKDLKEGDYVWTIQNGWTKLAATGNARSYPLTTNYNYSYTLDGFLFVHNKYPSMFTYEPIL